MPPATNTVLSRRPTQIWSVRASIMGAAATVEPLSAKYCAVANGRLPPPPVKNDRPSGRSEEHTSELQSHSDLVCRLLLEKKNAKVALETDISKLRRNPK